MKIKDGSFGSSDTLFAEITQHLAESFVEEGPSIAILDGKGGCWRSGREALPTSEELLRQYCSRVADGWEPATGLVEGWNVLAGQLHTGGRHHGYIVIGLAADGERTAAHQTLMETLLNQVNAVAELIQRNNHQHQFEVSTAKEPSCVN